MLIEERAVFVDAVDWENEETVLPDLVLELLIDEGAVPV